jgi:hypothetical protein
MNIEEINKASDVDTAVRAAIAMSIKDDRQYKFEHVITKEAWIAHQITDGSDIEDYHGTADGYIEGYARVWTNTTGGSYEYPEFRIPLVVFNNFLSSVLDTMKLSL